MLHLLFADEHRQYIALAALALALSALAFVYNLTRTPLAAIPGPWYSKFTGAIVTYHWLAGKRAKYVHTLHQKYGPSDPPPAPILINALQTLTFNVESEACDCY